MKILLPHVIILFSLVGCALAQHGKRSFTVADEIGLTHFDDPHTGRPEVVFSPDGRYFGVWSERGRLNLNQVEDSLRLYRRQDVLGFIEGTQSQPPSPALTVTKLYRTEGGISDWRWLPDSSGVAFTARTGKGVQLMLADLRSGKIVDLTSCGKNVANFDVRDREHYVYTIVQAKSVVKDSRAPATIGTGQSLLALLFPQDRSVASLSDSHLWAFIHGKRFEVKAYGRSVDSGDLALSPDGRSLVTLLSVRDVPISWETLYPPPYASYPFHIRSGEPARQYVKIDLANGSVKPLTNAPIGRDAGWGGGVSRPVWSADGSAVLLPSTFLASPDGKPSAPCVAVVEFSSRKATCVTTLKGRTDEKGYHFLLVTRALFRGGNKECAVVTTVEKSTYQTTEYQRTSDGAWHEVTDKQRVSIDPDLDVRIREGLDEPPTLIASNRTISKVIWNPNPQLDDIALGRAREYTWEDKHGGRWKGGLYEPVGYQKGQQYPLIIQTHGFRPNEFRPSGLFPTGSAARVFAAAGMFVLQIADDCPLDKPLEARCAVSSYESAVAQLVSDGLVNRDKVGIIGFSRTCFYVMEALVTSSVHFKAALITDGFMGTYSQYISWIDYRQSSLPEQIDSIYGGSPFGQNLQQWIKLSPTFNLDKITAPLEVVAEGPFSLMAMWEPYAALRYLHKPTDLIVLNTEEHVLTNPAMRLISQGGSVDWFRFWLQGVEDQDAGKVEQYRRWREFRTLQTRATRTIH